MPIGIGPKSNQAKPWSTYLILTIYSKPAVEPLSVVDAKTHLHVTGNDEDTYISALITDAREHVENYTGRALINQTWDLYVDQFPYVGDVITIPKAPLSSVTSITYVDTAGATQTLSSSVYTADTDSEPGRVYAAYNQTFPDIRTQSKAVKVRFVAGYGADGDSVPSPIVQAIRLLTQIEKEQPTGDVRDALEDSVARLLSPYRLKYL